MIVKEARKRNSMIICLKIMNNSSHLSSERFKY